MTAFHHDPDVTRDLARLRAGSEAPAQITAWQATEHDPDDSAGHYCC